MQARNACFDLQGSSEITYLFQYGVAILAALLTRIAFCLEKIANFKNCLQASSRWYYPVRVRRVFLSRLAAPRAIYVHYVTFNLIDVKNLLFDEIFSFEPIHNSLEHE